jgi:phage antirepressor YoqD-like protein
MNALTINAAITMTSLDLVEYINSQRGEGDAELRHDHFMAKVPKVLGEAAPKFSGTAFYLNGTGSKVERSIYTFPKREACLMAMSYSYDLQAKVFDRMTALEQQSSKPPAFLPDFTNPATAAIAWAEQFMAKEALAIENAARAKHLAVAAPKANALDLISAGDDAVTMTQASKLLGIKRELLTSWMHANRWIYRQNGSWVAYAQHIQNGRLQFKEARYTDDKTGQEYHSPYCHILPKGLTLLATHFARQVA